MSATAEIVDIPVQDETPELDGIGYAPEFPDATPEAPYGYFPDGRIRKRKPKTGATGKPAHRMPASDALASQAAGVLATLNNLLGLSLNMLGMPMTAKDLVNANEAFEKQAFEALRTDPALCRKILGAGATGGKVGLLMAYGMLGMAVVPAARTEYRAARALKQVEADDNAA